MSQVNNPANAPAKRVTEKGRIPMSIPLQRLAVPEIPGYYTRWFTGTSQRIASALRAGYEFVGRDEVELEEVGLASLEGNADMGTRVSVISGQDGAAKDGENSLILMKLREDLRQSDLLEMDNNNERVAAALRNGGQADNGESSVDAALRYIPRDHRQQVAGILQPKKR